MAYSKPLVALFYRLCHHSDIDEETEESGH